MAMEEAGHPGGERLRPRLLLYGTSGCHLCEQARALVAPLAEAFGWRLEEVDIADDEQLFARWGEVIPVLERTDRPEPLCWPFDQRMVLDCLAAPGARED